MNTVNRRCMSSPDRSLRAVYGYRRVTGLNEKTVVEEKTAMSSLEKVAYGAFCACPSLDGTLRVDLRSTKRAPARLSDISFVSAGKKRGFCQLCSRGPKGC